METKEQDKYSTPSTHWNSIGELDRLGVKEVDILPLLRLEWI